MGSGGGEALAEAKKFILPTIVAFTLLGGAVLWLISSDIAEQIVEIETAPVQVERPDLGLLPVLPLMAALLVVFYIAGTALRYFETPGQENQSPNGPEETPETAPDGGNPSPGGRLP